MKEQLLSRLHFLVVLVIVTGLIGLAIYSRWIKEYRSFASTRQQEGSVSVSLSIGEYHFRLFGYASSGALITLEGMGVFDQTYADEEGYFVFSNRFSPSSPREACLTARDQLGRVSAPLCLPPFPTQYNVDIGPVIMPPTLSFDKQDYFVGDEVVLTGQTIPKTQVRLASFTNDKVVIPAVETAADSNGNYGLTLPSASDKRFRIFSQTTYEGSVSPKSRTLNFTVLPIWMIIVRIFQIIFDVLKNRLLELIILTEITMIIVYFLRRYLHPHMIARNRSLALRPHYSLEKEENALVKREVGFLG